MKNGNHKDSCLFGEELVSYIYGELPANGRFEFENHLLDCSECTTEFAAVSESRLGVYEWHRDEFLPLETPHFSIPYQLPVVESEPQFGWLDALKGLLSPARLATAGGAFAAIIIAFGVLYVSFAPSDQMVAGSNKVVAPIEPANLPKVNVREIEPENVAIKPVVDEEVQPIRTASKTPQRTNRTVEAKIVKPSANRRIETKTTQATTSPRLGTYVETEDNSLRLADLVAEIDTY